MVLLAQLIHVKNWDGDAHEYPPYYSVCLDKHVFWDSSLVLDSLMNPYDGSDALSAMI